MSHKGRAIAAHTLKLAFDLPARVNASPSYAQGSTLQELLALEPARAHAQLLDLDLAHYSSDFGRGRLARAVAATYGESVREEDVLVFDGADAVIMNALSALTAPGAAPRHASTRASTPAHAHDTRTRTHAHAHAHAQAYVWRCKPRPIHRFTTCLGGAATPAMWPCGNQTGPGAGMHTMTL